jgi:hypothetical protein
MMRAEDKSIGIGKNIPVRVAGIIKKKAARR